MAKAPNLALLYDVLPPMPAVGDIVVYNGSAFSSLGGWDMGIPLPSGVTGWFSVGVDLTNGDILATGLPRSGGLSLGGFIAIRRARGIPGLGSQGQGIRSRSRGRPNGNISDDR